MDDINNNALKAARQQLNKTSLNGCNLSLVSKGYICCKLNCINLQHTSNYCEIHEELAQISYQADIVNSFIDNDLVDAQEALELLNQANVGIQCHAN